MLLVRRKEGLSCAQGLQGEAGFWQVGMQSIVSAFGKGLGRSGIFMDI